MGKLLHVVQAGGKSAGLKLQRTMWKLAWGFSKMIINLVLDILNLRFRSRERSGWKNQSGCVDGERKAEEKLRLQEV